jgi:phosphatidylserine decarboxylase
VKIDSAGLPFIAIAAVPAVVSAVAGATMLALVLGVLPIAIALFFRDPERTSPVDPALVLAPADGRVMFAGQDRPEEWPNGHDGQKAWPNGNDGQTTPAGAWQQVTIFLSLLDVHINRAPVDGRVTRVDYRAGQFLPAYRREAFQNEQTEIWIDHQGTTIVARQVVGVLARRIVCRVKPGDTVRPGARIGLMKFGSRMDVFVPPTATLRVKPGDTVRGGVTVIAELGRPSA